MKQYCRYCGRACLQDDDLFYCSAKEHIYYGAKAKRVNKCKHFSFVEFDLFNPDKKYIPKEKISNGVQVSIFDKGYE